MACRGDSAENAVANPRSALVVASDLVSRTACRSALEAGAWRVVIADTGVAAVVEARRDVPAVIVLDLQLRDVPGHEALAWLRSNPDLRDVPVVLIAGGAEDDDVIGRIGPSALLRRPVSRQSVTRALEGLSFAGG